MSRAGGPGTRPRPETPREGFLGGLPVLLRVVVARHGAKSRGRAHLAPGRTMGRTKAPKTIVTASLTYLNANHLHLSISINYRLHKYSDDVCKPIF